MDLAIERDGKDREGVGMKIKLWLVTSGQTGLDALLCPSNFFSLSFVRKEPELE